MFVATREGSIAEINHFSGFPLPVRTGRIDLWQPNKNQLTNIYCYITR